MSGGHFNYIQYTIDQTADEIEPFIINNGSNEQDQYGYNKHQNFSSEVIEQFKKGIYILRQAAAYVHCIDYLVSDDYGEDSFLEQLDLKLKKINTLNSEE